MEKEKLKRIYEAIKSDDVNLFTSFVVSKNELSLCFGRFPILSLCYLFKSRKILSKFENQLYVINKFEVVDEYFEIYKEFKKYAKKSLRLYLADDKIVYPIEMLAILDERNDIKNKYKFLFKNEEILIRFRKIYILNKKIEVVATREKFECPSKKFSFKQKFFAGLLSVIFICLSSLSFSSIVLVGSVFGKGTVDSPIYVSNEEEFITALEKGDKYYKLENDIVLTNHVSVDKFSGTLNGNGFVLTLKENQDKAIIQNLVGNVENLSVEFEVKGKEISSNYSIFAQNLTGIIDNCDFYGRINAKINAKEDAYVTVVAGTNSGTISNSNVKLNSEIENMGQTNAYLSAYAGINTGLISNSMAVDGKFVSDTVDLSGIASENKGTISEVVNNIELFQTSSKEWNPNCAGISMMNYGKISSCKNLAKISAESTRVDDTTAGTPEVIVGGLVCINYNLIEESKNEGEVVASADKAYILAGGIAAANFYDEAIGQINKCKSVSKIVAKSKQSTVYVGGITAQNSSKIIASGFEGDIDAKSNSESLSAIKVFAGGVAGYNKAMVENCYASVSYIEPEKNKVENDVETVLNIYGAILGCVNTIDYFASSFGYFTFEGTNNHFVSNDTQNCLGYWFIVNGNSLVSVQKVSANDFMFVEHEKIEEIPSEVRNVWADWFIK